MFWEEEEEEEEEEGEGEFNGERREVGGVSVSRFSSASAAETTHRTRHERFVSFLLSLSLSLSVCVCVCGSFYFLIQSGNSSFRRLQLLGLETFFFLNFIGCYWVFWSNGFGWVPCGGREWVCVVPRRTGSVSRLTRRLHLQTDARKRTENELGKETKSKKQNKTKQKRNTTTAATTTTTTTTTTKGKGRERERRPTNESASSNIETLQ